MHRYEPCSRGRENVVVDAVTYVRDFIRQTSGELDDPLEEARIRLPDAEAG